MAATTWENIARDHNADKQGNELQGNRRRRRSTSQPFCRRYRADASKKKLMGRRGWDEMALGW